ncbi:MAG TPA: SDR family oxidoreductase [Nitrospiria bacterium]|nr:SDR family oxidoreductase [Nitrospiria bacterium]
MNSFDQVKEELRKKKNRWLVTGAAGFIGSHLAEFLLKQDQEVTGLDNFSTGKQENLNQVKNAVSNDQKKRFQFIEGDIQDLSLCQRACGGIDFILHQAALGSVPRSIENPIVSNGSNVTGFLNLLVAAKEAKVKRLVYASSSAVYGDHPALPKTEDVIGKPLSPYAVTKVVNEHYAGVFASLYGMELIGLRYFNVFGARQDPNGAYAAVIPLWISSMIRNETVYINGTGETSRDFCYIDNVVQVNILSATATNGEAVNQVYNVAVNEQTSLTELYGLLRERLIPHYPHLQKAAPVYRDFRTGDVLHSLADISKAEKLLGFRPSFKIGEGLDYSLTWYIKSVKG